MAFEKNSGSEEFSQLSETGNGDGSSISDLARYSTDPRENEKVSKFQMCGATNRIAGFLSSDHPYRPETSCRWLIRGPPGTEMISSLVFFTV